MKGSVKYTNLWYSQSSPYESTEQTGVDLKPPALQCEPKFSFVYLWPHTSVL